MGVVRGYRVSTAPLDTTCDICFRRRFPIREDEEPPPHDQYTHYDHEAQDKSGQLILWEAVVSRRLTENEVYRVRVRWNSGADQLEQFGELVRELEGVEVVWMRRIGHG